MAQTQPGTTNQPTGGTPDRQALLKAYQDVVKSEQGKKDEVARAEQPTRPVFLIVMGGLLVALLAVLLTQPAWLFPRAPEETPAIKEASLKVRMYVEVERIEQYRAAHGRYPATLGEAGVDTTALTYVTTDGGYSLTGKNRGVTATFVAGSNPREFLGNSYQLISQRRKP